MAFTASGARIWPLPPDWSAGVTETLAWGTDVMHASATAVSQHIGYRLAPRRTLAFEVGERNASRRIGDMLIAGHSGRWLLPIWPDVQRLAAAVTAGDTAISCATDGFDFVAGGKALLWQAPNVWEVVSIASLSGSGLTLSAALAASWIAATRLYPLRSARLTIGAEERLRGDNFGRRSLSFTLDEACDWPVLTGMTTYLTHPVMDVRPDESDDSAHSVTRLEQIVTSDAGVDFIHDLPNQALRSQATHWKLFGRPDHTWFRSLIYTLDGRRMPMWLPSFAADLKLASTIAASSATISVEWAGYTLFGLDRHNRKDVRIELCDGTVYYRRITAAIEAGDTETLTLDSFLSDNAIAPSAIRQISFMALATLASDSVELQHVTDADGTATSTLGWQAVVPDV